MSDWGGVWEDTDINGGLDIKYVQPSSSIPTIIQSC
jgi:hypothetical protein